MIERLVIVSILIIVGYVAFALYRKATLHHAAEQAPRDPLLANVPSNSATIVYFTTPGCIPCRTQQQPALEKLKSEMGDSVYIVKVDASEDPETAKRWGVMSAPTTFILGRDGKPSAVNYGAADAATLRQQVTKSLA
ncbi:thioredoxin family protein [Phototrophicus methaneseepsis]|uniref:Thioredoxin family protein n=1 Tax=Phototrophicus methaneseepsis TaxID=2710758 RepID=A0A7S8EDP7_9CHLR|nr:thioredoxin family protein [Phototrophicus methaneseepsis]QPC85075.1 thioredoxin family protein [Phototrophicus methaneseepsis]